jgi:hydrogenase maturation protease
MKTLIIGMGNDYRCDDAVGLVVARRIRQSHPVGVTVLEQSGEGTALMEAWKDADTVIVVDAVQSGATPGRIHRLNAQAQKIPASFFHYSTHAFSVAEAVELARALNQLPPRLILYGVEGKDFAAGVGLSAEVEKAASGVKARVIEELRALTTGQTVCTNSHSSTT